MCMIPVVHCGKLLQLPADQGYELPWYLVVTPTYSIVMHTVLHHNICRYIYAGRSADHVPVSRRMGSSKFVRTAYILIFMHKQAIKKNGVDYQ